MNRFWLILFVPAIIFCQDAEKEDSTVVVLKTGEIKEVQDGRAYIHFVNPLKMKAQSKVPPAIPTICFGGGAALVGKNRATTSPLVTFLTSLPHAFMGLLIKCFGPVKMLHIHVSFACTTLDVDTIPTPMATAIKFRFNI